MENNIIYNLIILLNDTFDTMDIDNQNFIDWICKESGITETDYRKIMNLMEE